MSHDMPRHITWGLHARFERAVTGPTSNPDARQAARLKIWSGELGRLKTIVCHSMSSLFNGSSHCLDVANILNNDSPVVWVQVTPQCTVAMAWCIGTCNCNAENGTHNGVMTGKVPFCCTPLYL